MEKLNPTDYNQKLSLEDMQNLYDSVSIQDCITCLSIVCSPSEMFTEEKAYKLLFFTRQLMIQKGQNQVDENLYFNLYEHLANILTKDYGLSERIKQEICALIKMLAEIHGRVALNLTQENYYFFMEKGELEILNAACSHIDIIDFNHLIKLSSIAVKFYVEGGEQNDGMLKLAKDLIKTVGRMIESDSVRIEECATEIKTNTEMANAWHVLNQYQQKELMDGSKLPSLTTVKFLYHRCKLEASLLSHNIPKATFHLETMIAWTNQVSRIEETDLRRCYTIYLINFFTNLKLLEAETDIQRVLDSLIVPHCQIKIDGDEDLDEVKELLLEAIHEGNIQSDYECVAKFYRAYLSNIDPFDLDISLIGYVLFFYPNVNLLKDHMEKHMEDEDPIEMTFHKLLSFFINIDEFSITNRHLHNFSLSL